MKRTRPQVIIFDHEHHMANSMIQKWRWIAKEAIKTKGFFGVALSGGRTPVLLYQKLANLKEGLPWDTTHIFAVDERFVPFHYPDSNYGMLRNTLLNPVEIPPQNIHPILVEEATPQIAARKYEEELRKFFHLSPDQYPEFDLILLGIGEDGHTASLFPGHPALNDTSRLATAVLLDEIRHHRITLTLPVINNAKNIIFFVTGGNKAGVVEKVIRKKYPALPAAMVNPQNGELLFFLDVGAGAQLSSRKERR